jgi:DNA polymerase-3 subunit delta'
MRFADIPGQAQTKTILLEAIGQGKVAHALLMTGNEGSAVLAMALAFAQRLLCESPLKDDACGQCAACHKASRLIHPDLHFVFPVTTAKNKDALSSSYLPEWRKFLLRHPYGSLSEWLELIEAENKQPNIAAAEAREVLQTLSLKAFEGPYKIMLIWLAEYLHATAANVLLKVLEEPPPFTVFLLVSQQPEQILTTILSRTQLIRIRDFEEAEMRQYLSGRFPGEDLGPVLQQADGNLNLALKLLSGMTDAQLALFRQWMRDCYSFKAAELLDFSEAFQRMGKEEQKQLLEYGLEVFRSCLYQLSGVPELVRMGPEATVFSANFSKQLSIGKLGYLTEQFNQSLQQLERNASPRILLTSLSIRIAGQLRPAAS